MNEIVGRIEEKKQFKELLQSNESEFVAVYGRRRVGKTFLIREYFKQHISFHLTGLSNATLPQQLVNFHTCMCTGYPKYKETIPVSWFEAFQQLIKRIEKTKKQKHVIFLDELPWLDTPKSYFISALEHFWNSWASARKDILLIVCGSAASWMIHKLINNKGGLHNRITHRMKINPFTLKECDEYFKYKKISFNRYQIIELYSVMGGIPYYLDAVKKGKSAAQNIDTICFSEQGLLKNEFSNLYASLFKHAEHYEAVVKALSKKSKGLTRDEIINTSKIQNGGGTSKILSDLEESGFIRKYTPFGKQYRESLYQLVDFYTLFYFNFIQAKKNTSTNFWINALNSSLHKSWSGYAFEQVCLLHIHEIKNALGIRGIISSEASWRSQQKADGAQIDLLIDRNDQIINVCEMKFSTTEFIITKDYSKNLRNKIALFGAETQTKKAINLTLITTYGVKENQYAQDLIQNDITIDCFFE